MTLPDDGSTAFNLKNETMVAVAARWPAAVVAAAAKSSSVLRLHSLPVSITEVDGGILLQRGQIVLRISGERAAALVQSVLHLTARKSLSEAEIIAAQPAQDTAAATRIVEELRARRLLVPDESVKQTIEDPLDVFFWGFGLAEWRAELEATPIVVVGSGELAAYVTGALEAGGAPTRRVSTLEVPHPPHQPVVACAQVEGLSAMLGLNERSITEGFALLPVTCSGMTGWVGPLVVPGETPCIECAVARGRSQHGEPVDALARDQLELLIDTVEANHPSILTLIAATAAFELIKYLLLPATAAVVGGMIEVNPVRAAIRRARLLRAPRCPACARFNPSSPIDVMRQVSSDLR